VVRPALIVVLGATAARSLLGSGFRLLADRGRVLADILPIPVVATVHPSAILRAPADEARQRELGKFIEDLQTAREASSEILHGFPQ
jgi:DNA polymerase